MVRWHDDKSQDWLPRRWRRERFPSTLCTSIHQYVVIRGKNGGWWPDGGFHNGRWTFLHPPMLFCPCHRSPGFPPSEHLDFQPPLLYLSWKGTFTREDLSKITNIENVTTGHHRTHIHTETSLIEVSRRSSAILRRPKESIRLFFVPSGHWSKSWPDTARLLSSSEEFGSCTADWRPRSHHSTTMSLSREEMGSARDTTSSMLYSSPFKT